MTKIPGDEWFFMDDCMKPLIKLLNQRGYDTKFCCSGHPTQAVWKYPVSSQESHLNFKYQFGKFFAGFRLLLPWGGNGYILFKRKKDRDLIFHELKKTKYGDRIFHYSFDEKYLGFKIKGLKQEEIDNFWKDFTRQIKKVI